MKMKMKMGMRLKDIIKMLTPPVILNLSDRLLSDQYYGLSGDYSRWNDAMAASTGYDSEIILEKTKEALLKVKNGEAVYERDSVLFDDIQYSWPLLAGLLWVAARYGGKLNVLDFGGSLGSTFFQNRCFLTSLPMGVRWNIVEQIRYVENGKKWFENDFLHFYSDLSVCLAETKPNVALLSSVLQYLEHPYLVLDQIQNISCNVVIIDRTPFWNGPEDHLCVQTVPPDIYPASYPSWIFSRKRFYDHVQRNWQVLAEFDNSDKLPGPVSFDYQGVIIVRREKIS